MRQKWFWYANSNRKLIFHARVRRKNVQPALVLKVKIYTQDLCRINQKVFKQ